LQPPPLAWRSCDISKNGDASSRTARFRNDFWCENQREPLLYRKAKEFIRQATWSQMALISTMASWPLGRVPRRARQNVAQLVRQSDLVSPDWKIADEPRL
jgi:hypothetical protein